MKEEKDAFVSKPYSHPHQNNNNNNHPSIRSKVKPWSQSMYKIAILNKTQTPNTNEHFHKFPPETKGL